MLIPMNEDAEHAVLAAMLLAPKSVVPVVADIISADDFYRDSDGKLFSTIMAMWAEDEAKVDQLTVSSAMPDKRDYIYALTECNLPIANAKYYAEEVRHTAAQRKLITAGMEITELGQDAELSIADMLDKAESRLTSLRPNYDKNTYKAGALGRRVVQSIENSELPTTVTTGFSQIDDIMHGFHGGNLVIVGARPGVGKTCLGLSVARKVAEHGTVMYFSLEMKGEELAERLLASEACVSLTKIRERSVNEQETAAICSSNDALDKLDLRLVDDSSMTMLQLASRIRLASKRAKIKLVVVDYLQLMSLGMRSESRREEVSEMSRRLKSLAMELDIPIMALSQLNRISTFDGAKVDISQLRESGSLEQDADCVWLLDWPKDKTVGFCDRVLLVKVAKNRHGPTGEAELAWLPSYQRLED